jgi:hypothetical protein
MPSITSDNSLPPALLVRPRVARRLLGNCGNERLYELLKMGVLESFVEGRARYISVASIHRYIADRLAAASGTPASALAAAPPRRCRKSRKNGSAGPVTP